MTQTARDASGAPIAALRPARTEKLTVGATHQKMTTAPTNTTVIRLAPSVDIYYKLGSDPEATASDSPFLAGGAVEYIPIPDGWNISVIQVSEAGFATVSECR